MLNRREKIIHVWNKWRVSKQWQNFHFLVNYSGKNTNWCYFSPPQQFFCCLSKMAIYTIWQCIVFHEHVYVSWPHFTAAVIYDVSIFGSLNASLTDVRWPWPVEKSHVDCIEVERQSISAQKWTENLQAKQDTAFWKFICFYWRLKLCNYQRGYNTIPWDFKNVFTKAF